MQQQWDRRLFATRSDVEIEHALRYKFAAPLIAGAALWVDLGCGTGQAASAGVGDRGALSSLLVDSDDEALRRARQALSSTEMLRADLATSEGANAVEDAIGDAEAVVTCFEMLAHLEDFVACVDLLIRLSQRCTIVLSVPNEAFWSQENPHHPTMWGAGAVDELRRLLPADHMLCEQLPLTGSAIAPARGGEVPLAPLVATEQDVPSHFILAFGPRINELAPIAANRVVDSNGERARARQHESDVAVLTARIAELERAR
jgi:hypothetical protein